MEERAEVEARLAAGRVLTRDDRHAEALAHFRELAARHPAEPRAHYELASTLDRLDREGEAIPRYRRAIALGLAGDDLARAFLQLGSSLRNIGEHAEAVCVLAEGRARFPDHAPTRVFLALALHSVGKCREAVAELLELALREIDSPEMRYYFGHPAKLPALEADPGE